MMIMMRTGRIWEHQAVEGAVLAMAMTMTMARVRRTRRAVRKGPGKRREQQTGMEIGRETIKSKVLLNKPQQELISLVLLHCSGRRKGIRQTRTRRAD